jgi:hypothetical protein
MPLVDEPSKETPHRRFYLFLRHNLNFYRLHILYLCVLVMDLPAFVLKADQFSR